MLLLPMLLLLRVCLALVARSLPAAQQAAEAEEAAATALERKRERSAQQQNKLSTCLLYLLKG